MTVLYSIIHMLVDGMCALAMFGNFVNDEKGYFYFLIYNFCAFALQMPIGALQDMLNLWYKEKQKEYTLCFVILGVGFTALGAMTHPIVLGIGNALFHIGGGVGAIREDEAKGWQGRGLGIFVAPGAFGLYVGTLIAKKGVWKGGILVAICLTVGLTVVAAVLHKRKPYVMKTINRHKKEMSQSGCALLGISCFFVVILRSYIGMAVAMPWKQIPILGLISVLAVVCGKAAGGFWAARLGYGRTAGITLLLAALAYLGLELAPFGIFALFAFNMTMPMTLYLLIRALPQLPGFSFGMLTFGLFLGFLPAYFGWQTGWSSQVTGALGSILSMVILGLGIWQGGKHVSVSD